MTREEALSLCVEEVKAVHSEYADLEEGLVEELCTRLTVSGEEITAYLNEWREATEFHERNAALTEVGEQLSCRHVPSALRWRADGQQECSACEVERAHQHWLEVERLQIYEEDRQRAAAGELLDCRHVPTNMVYGDDGYMWCRVCRPHGYDDAPGRAADTP
jgi:hypothetical protein